MYADGGTPDDRHGGLKAGAECVFLVCVATVHNDSTLQSLLRHVGTACTPHVIGMICRSGLRSEHEHVEIVRSEFTHTHSCMHARPCQSERVLQSAASAISRASLVF